MRLAAEATAGAVVGVRLWAQAEAAKVVEETEAVEGQLAEGVEAAVLRLGPMAAQQALQERLVAAALVEEETAVAE